MTKLSALLVVVLFLALALPACAKGQRAPLDSDQDGERSPCEAPLDTAPLAPVSTSGGAFTISGAVFEDLDGDGEVDEGECGIGGVLVEAHRKTSSLHHSDRDGTYSFTFAPGASSITLSMDSLPPSGFWRPTSPSHPTVGVTMEKTECGHSFTIPQPSRDLTSLNFGLQPVPGHGTISGHVFLDADQDGIKGPKEPALGRSLVILHWREDLVCLAPGGSPLTGHDGEFTFASLPGGRWSLDAYLWATPGEGRLFVPTTEPGQVLTLEEGEILSVDVGFAEVEAAFVAVTVVNDRDGDGEVDSGEPGISGWRVCLMGDHGVLCDQTDENGKSTLGPAAPRHFRMEVHLPEGWAPTGSEGAALEGEVAEGETASLLFLARRE